jgi:hypothetical protein
MRALFLACAALAACTPTENNFSDLTPEIAVAPTAPYDFGEVVVGQSAAMDLKITNGGRTDLHVTGISFDPPTPSVYAAGGTTQTIGVGDSWEIPVTFVPQEFAPYPADLLIDSDDPDGVFRYELDGTGRPERVPDIEVSADCLDFGTVAPGETGYRFLTISNVGEATLNVGQVQRTGSGAFSFETDPSNTAIAPGKQILYTVEYRPLTDAGDSGVISLPSDDGDEPTVEVCLSGNGGGGDPYPTAAIEWGDPGTIPDKACPASVAPVADLPLSGEASTDLAGLLPLTYAWSITAAPAGAQGTLSDPAIADPTLHVDLAGDWTVELQVANTDGTLSAPASCLISAIPEEDVRVELTWDGATSDLDLHLADALSTPIYGVPGDVSWCNLAPDWGVAGPTDDPVLDQDDASGYGPESIAISIPAEGTYPVQVHYFARNLDFGVNATVKVWLRGALAFSGVQALDYNEVWDVGQINWPAGTFGVHNKPPAPAVARQCPP